MLLHKSTIFIFLFISLPLLISAQVIGIKAGVNNSRLLIENSAYSDFNHKTKDVVDLLAGITVDIKINSLISIEPGIIYYGKRMAATTDDPIFSTVIISEYKLTYFNVPIPIRVNYEKNDKTFFGFAGGYFDFGTKGNLSFKGGSFATHNVWPKEKEERRLKKFDYGTTFGFGFALSNIQFELFSNIGFGNIATDFDRNTSVKNRTLGFAITFRLGKHGTDFD